MKIGIWINSLMCGVASACVLAGAGQTARAEIVDSFSQQFVRPVPIYSNEFDINEDGAVDVVFDSYNNSALGAFPGNATNFGTYYFFSGTSGAQVLAAGDSLQILSAGDLIGDSEDWTTNILELAFQPLAALSNNPLWLGPLGESRQGFIGLKLQAADGPHYGWIAVSLPGTNQSNPLVTDWAFETTPNQPLWAGNKPVFFTASFTGANEVPANASSFSGRGSFTLDQDTNGNYSLSCVITMNSNFRPHSAQIVEAGTPMAKCGRPIANLGPYAISNVLQLAYPGTPPYFPLLPPLNPIGAFPGIIVTSVPPIVIGPGPVLIVTNIFHPTLPINHNLAIPQLVTATASSVNILQPQPLTMLVYNRVLSLTRSQVSDLLAGQFYVNFLTGMYQEGELRGEILPTASIPFSATLSGTNGVFRTSSPYHGEALLYLLGNTIRLDVALDPFTPTSIGVYEPSHSSPRPSLIYSMDPLSGFQIPGTFPGIEYWPVGFPGQLLYFVTILQSGVPLENDFYFPSLTDVQVYELMHGNGYIDVTTGAFQKSEISGWWVPTAQ